MFTEIRPLLDDTKTMALTIALEGELLRVTVMQKNAQGTPFVPLTLLASAEALDAEFAQAIQNFGTTNTSMAAQMEAFEAEAKAALEAAKPKVADKPKPAQATSVKAAPSTSSKIPAKTTEPAIQELF